MVPTETEAETGTGVGKGIEALGGIGGTGNKRDGAATAFCLLHTGVSFTSPLS